MTTGRINQVASLVVVVRVCPVKDADTSYTLTILQSGEAEVGDACSRPGIVVVFDTLGSPLLYQLEAELSPAEHSEEPREVGHGHPSQLMPYEEDKSRRDYWHARPACLHPLFAFGVSLGIRLLWSATPRPFSLSLFIYSFHPLPRVARL